MTALVVAVAATGCATQSLKSTLSVASLPSMPAAVAAEPGRIDGTSAEVYGLIAAGAIACWFAVNGQLKKSHIFYADADPLAKGGAVEVAVLERDPTAPKPWGAKAFRVSLAQAGEQTTITIDNLKMPEATAVQMRADVFHWAQGGKNCKLKPIEVAPPEPAPVTVAAKSKVKPKIKAVAKAPAPAP